MLTYYRPMIKDIGSEILRFCSGNIGTITANTTNRFGLGGFSDLADTAVKPGHTGYIDEAFISCFTVPVDADGTILLNIVKFDSGATTAVNIATGFNVEGLTANKTARVSFLTTLTDTQRTMHFGDSLYIELVNNTATIDTQMVAGAVAVHVKLIT